MPNPPSQPPRTRSGEHGAVRAFGKYFLVRKLAEGGMAEIFLAKQVGAEGFERNVVIKRMLQHLSAVPDFVGMFLDEARLAAKLSHPNIIQINDLGLADGCYYISMEYLAGEDFSTMLRTAGRRREFVPLPVVLRVIADAALGLNFAHDFTDDVGSPLNIVHRDVSPSNIYVTYEGQVKVLDFGIAKAESRVTNTTAGIVKGKYVYMSPEQARSAKLDRRSDVFSLGLCLYEACTNVRPFSRDNDLAILNAVLQCDYQPPRKLRPDLPAEVEAIILKALSPRADDRFQTASELAAELERYLGATTTGGAGRTAVQAFLRAFFGDERFMQKTRIPTLATLAANGVDVPGFTNPLAPKTEPGSGRNTDGVTAVVKTPTSSQVRTGGGLVSRVVEPTRKSSRGAVLVAALLLVAGVSAGTAWYFTRATTARGLADAGTKAVEPSDAGGQAVVAPPPLVDAGAPTPVDGGETPAPAVVKPIKLTPQEIARTVLRNSGPVFQCAREFQSELTSATTEVVVEVAVDRSGRVASAKSQAGGKLGTCVEQKVRQIRFPPNTGCPPVLLPFQFRKQ